MRTFVDKTRGLSLALALILAGAFLTPLSAAAEDGIARPTAGKLRVAIILAKFQNSPSPDPYTAAQLSTRIFNGPLNAWFKEVSSQKAEIIGNVFGWYTLPRTDRTSDDRCDMFSDSSRESELENVVKTNSIDAGAYDYFIYAVAHSAKCFADSGAAVRTFTTLSGTRKNMPIVMANLSRVPNTDRYDPTRSFDWSNLESFFAHELLHTLGFYYHASGLECGKGNILFGTKCSFYQYGNSFDPLGFKPIVTLHPSAIIKEQLGWLTATDIKTITSTGTYSIKNLESNSGIRAAKIVPQNYPYAPFYLEFRRGVSFDGDLNRTEMIPNTKGLFVNVRTKNQQFPILLDMTPTADTWANDDAQDSLNPTLNYGANVFEDVGKGIKIGPVRSVSSTSITFDVTMTTPQCVRHAPASPTFDSTSVPLGYQIVRGQSLQLNVNVWNQDSLPCKESGFEVLVDAPSDWGIQIGKNSSLPHVTVPPEEFAHSLEQPQSGVPVVINVPYTATLGVNPITFRVRNIESGLIGEIGQIKVSALREPPIPPTIQSQPKNVTLQKSGSAVFFHVGATGSGILKYQWQSLKSGTWVDINGATRSSYSISQATPTMNGKQFRCKVWNDVSAIYSKTVTLRITNARPIVNRTSK